MEPEDDERQQPRKGSGVDFRVEVYCYHVFSLSLDATKLVRELIPLFKEYLLASGRSITKVQETLERIERKMEQMDAETKQILSDIDGETTRIATAIESIVANSKDPELKSRLQTHLDALKGLAADPNNIIPGTPIGGGTGTGEGGTAGTEPQTRRR